MFRLLLLCLLASPSVAAQPLPDLEDHQDALLVVPARSAQVDVASSYTWHQPSQTDAGLSARLGLGTGWEVRLGLPPYTHTAATPDFGAPTVGVKAELGEALGWTLASTLDTSLPIERPDVETVVTLTSGRDMPAGLALELVGELAVDTGDATPTGAVALAVARRVLRQLDASVQVAADIEALAVSAVVIQNGYALLLSPTAQLNAAVGIGLASAPDALISFGGSIRL